MIVDGLAFLAPPAGLGAHDAADCLRGMDRLGIGHALAAGVRRTGGESPNLAIAAAAAAHPGRFTALARISPWMAGWRDELARCAGDTAFAGLLLHPWEDGFPVHGPAGVEIIGAAAELGWPVTIAAGYPWVSEALQVGDVARQFPRTTFVLTNEGQLNMSGLGAADVALLLELAANVVLHTTGAYREDFLTSLISRFGPGRLMYASGFPRFSQEYELRRVEWADGVSAQAREHILGGTAQTVFPQVAAQTGGAR
jgi:predicted TIM-barrel fold metal-dependent hydrolase